MGIYKENLSIFTERGIKYIIFMILNKNIFKLEPGCYLEFKENKIKINNYWSVNNFFPKNTNNKTLKTYFC